MKCAREILAERKNKVDEFRASLVESTIRFCEEYIGPFLENKLNDLTFNSKETINFTPDYAKRVEYGDTFAYYTYNNYSFDYGVLKAYLNNRCFDTAKVQYHKNHFCFYARIDLKCSEVE